MAMNEDFVSYELAVKLKACGFDEPCKAFYEHIDGKMYFSVDGDEDWSSGVDYSAPHIYHAQKWLREKWKIFVEVTSEALYDWDFFVMELDEDTNVGLVRGQEMYPSHEAALSAGLSAALELIKKGE